MDIKIFLISIITVLLLVTITFAAAINTTNTDKRESPLFGIRTRLEIGDKIQNLKDNIKARFFGERLFFLPFHWLRDIDDFSEMGTWSLKQLTCAIPITCDNHPKGCSR